MWLEKQLAKSLKPLLRLSIRGGGQAKCTTGVCFNLLIVLKLRCIKTLLFKYYFSILQNFCEKINNNIKFILVFKNYYVMKSYLYSICKVSVYKKLCNKLKRCYNNFTEKEPRKPFLFNLGLKPL